MSESIIIITETIGLFESVVNEQLSKGYSLHGEPVIVKVYQGRDNYGQKRPAVLVFTRILKIKSHE